MSLFELGSINKFFIIIFTFPLFYALRDYCFREFYTEKYDFAQHPLRVSLLMFIGEILAFLLNFAVEFFNKKDTNDQKNNKNLINLNAALKQTIGIQSENNKIKIIIGLLILNSVIDLIAYTALTVLCIVEVTNTVFATNMRILNLFFIWLFSKIFLKITLYKHQILSFVLIFIGFLIALIPSIIDHKDEVGIVGFIVFILVYLFYSIKQIGDSILINTFFLSPFKVLGWQGVIGVILCFLSTLILTFINCTNTKICYEDKPFETFKGLIIPKLQSGATIRYIVLSLIFIALSFFMNSMLMIIKSIYTANHRSICDALNALLVWVISLLIDSTLYSEDFDKISHGNLVGYIFIFFGALIFNETIILNVCNLNEDIKTGIEVRAMEEFIDTETDYLEIKRFGTVSVRKRKESKDKNEDYNNFEGEVTKVLKSRKNTEDNKINEEEKEEKEEKEKEYGYEDYEIKD